MRDDGGREGGNGGGGRDGGKGERMGEVEAKEGEGRRKVLK